MSSKAFDDLIKGLDDLNKQNTIDIYVPSAGKDLEFKLLSVSQHKDIIKTAFEGYAGIVRSNCVFNDIINHNCLEEHEFLLSDRSYIILQLRLATTGSKYSVGDKLYSLDDLPTPNFDFERSATLEYNNICVDVCEPSLSNDTKIYTKFIAEIRATPDQKDIDMVNAALAYELVKFIRSIKLGDEEFELMNFNIHDRKRLVDSLPLKLNRDIISWLGEFRGAEDKNLTFNDGTTVEIDASFLAGD